MHTHETWQVVVRSAASRVHELATYLVNAPDDPRGGATYLPPRNTRLMASASA
jgi:hypothetical protein